MKKQKIELSRYRTNDLGIIRKNGKFIPNSSDNLFSDYLNGLYNNSPTHQCIIDDLTGYTVGMGLESENDEDQAKLDEYFNKKDLTKITATKYRQADVKLEIVTDKLNGITEINNIDPSQIRVGELDGNTPSWFLFKKDWNPKSGGYSGQSIGVPSFDLDEPRSILSWFDSGTFDVPYGRPSYISGADAIELEISIYTMHNHGAQNGMFPSMIIAKETSGDVTLDEADTLETQRQASGVSVAGKVITTYFPQGGVAPVFTTPNLTGIDKVFENQYATSESGILKAHRIPSPSLISGLAPKATGFSSPEDEMQWAKNELMSKIVEPQREEILQILNPLFSALGIESEVKFKDTDTKNVEDIKQDTSQELSEVNLLDEFINTYGEDESLYSEWDIASVMVVDHDLEDQLDAEIAELNKPFVKLASTGVAFPNAKSSQDGNKGDVQYKVRYRYAGDKVGDREFCKKMLSFNKLYRKEDLIRMGDMPVNAGFGIKGADTYSVWLYHGGIYCHHKFERITFVKKGLIGGIDTRNPKAKTVTESQADQRDMNPGNDKKVGTRTIDQPNRGRYTFSAIITKLKDIWQ